MEINDLLISPTATIKKALSQLNQSSMKVLFIIDDDQRLIGTLTDGDIRRSLLNDIALESKIDVIYNKNPVFIQEDSYSEEKVKKLFLELRIELIPIVDQDKRIIRLISWSEYFSDKKIDAYTGPALNIPVVIMAGGKGTRMAPFTNVLPKPLIPVGDKTILETIIENFVHYGITKFYFTVNFRAEMIQAYFNCIDKQYEVMYLREKEFYGTAGSLSLLPDSFNETFIVSNCDIIVRANIAKVLDFHRKSGALLTVLSSVQTTKIPYGVVHFESGGVVTGLEEKPEFTFCINTGVYILEPECLKYIPEGTLFHMTHLIDALMADGKKVATYPVNGNDYIDVGQWDEYKKAVSILDLGK